MNEGAKQTSFAELAADFPASIPEYLARKANDGVDIPADILSPQDLNSLVNLRAFKSSTSTGSLASSQLSSLLWLEVAQIYLQEGLLADAEAACSQSLKCNEIYAPAMGIFGKIEEIRETGRLLFHFIVVAWLLMEGMKFVYSEPVDFLLIMLRVKCLFVSCWKLMMRLLKPGVSLLINVPQLVATKKQKPVLNAH